MPKLIPVDPPPFNAGAEQEPGAVVELRVPEDENGVLIVKGAVPFIGPVIVEVCPPAPVIVIPFVAWDKNEEPETVFAAL